MLIVSVPGRLVHDPMTNRVVDDGGLEIDPTNVFWARLLADGDVKEATPAKAAKIQEKSE